MTWLSAVLLLSACESEQTVVEEMERSLYGSQGAVAAQLVGLEMVWHTFEEPDTQLRHGTSCGCPCLQRIGSSPPFVVELDYDAAGCLPESGLLPTSVSGHAIVDWDGQEATVTFDSIEVGLQNPVSGSLTAVLDEALSEVELAGSLDLASWAVDLDTSTTIDADAMTFRGTAEVAGPHQGGFSFKNVVLPFDDITPPCPAPARGTAVLDADPEVVLDYAEPGDGFVTVERKNRLSESVDYCEYRTGLF